MLTKRPRARVLAGCIAVIFMVSSVQLCCWADLCHSQSECSIHEHSRTVSPEEPAFPASNEDAVWECPGHECLQHPDQILLPSYNAGTDSHHKALRSVNGHEMVGGDEASRNVINAAASSPHTLNGSDLITKKCAFLS
jgi:hypothetical protein